MGAPPPGRGGWWLSSKVFLSCPARAGGRAATAPLGALREVREGGLLEDRDRRVADLLPHGAQGPGDELRTRVGVTPRRVADGRELALEEPDDAFERDLLGRVVEAVATVRAADGPDDTGGPEGRHHLLEDGARRVGGVRDLLESQRPAVGDGEREDRPRSVVGTA